jgi:hypothetical protein
MPMPFVKGDPRINRNGRPKKAQALAEYFRGHPKCEDIKQMIIDRAALGEELFVKMFMEYGFGKPVSSIELSGPDGDPIQITHGIDAPPQESFEEWAKRKELETGMKYVESTTGTADGSDSSDLV